MILVMTEKRLRQMIVSELDQFGYRTFLALHDSIESGKQTPIAETLRKSIDPCHEDVSSSEASSP